MKKSSNLIIGIAAAAVTFGSLFAIAGSRNFGGYGYNNWYRCDRYNREYRNNFRQDQNQAQPQPLKPDSSKTNF